MRQKLGKIIPESELRLKAELVLEINRLKAERGAIILGHNYMEPALFHTVPDVVGDSLYLSREAARTAKDPIIFCGVRFMAETAKILNPDKTVLLPAKVAGCSLAAGITAEQVRNIRSRNPGFPVVTYINTYADVKAETDVCCTSANAERVVRSFGNRTVIFLPDQYMAANIARALNRRLIYLRPDGSAPEPVPAEGAILGWGARCEVHEKFTVQDIRDVRSQFPEVAVVTHPECSPEVVDASDYSGGTSQMVDYVRTSKAPQFLLLTECSMGDNIIAENPQKEILRLCSVRCPHMNEITLEDTLSALRENRYRIEVEESVRFRALTAVQRMLDL